MNPNPIVQEAERLLEGITPGDWASGPPAWFRGQRNPEDGKRPITAGNHGTLANVYGRENAEFIAASPRLVRDLLSALSAALQQGKKSTTMRDHPRDADSKDDATAFRNTPEPITADVAGYEIDVLCLRHGERGAPDVTAERRRQRDGSSLWAVKSLSEVLNVHGDWEYEPIPSSRDDAFTRRCRFGSLQAGIDAWKCQP